MKIDKDQCYKANLISKKFPPFILRTEGNINYKYYFSVIGGCFNGLSSG